MIEIGYTVYQAAKDYFLYEGTNHVRVARINKAICNAMNSQTEYSYQKVELLADAFQNSKEFYYVDIKLVQNKVVDIEKVKSYLNRLTEDNQSLVFGEYTPEAMLVSRIFHREYIIATEIADIENPNQFPINNFSDINEITKKTIQKLKESFNRDLERNDGVLSEFVYSKKFEKELAISATKKIAIFTGIIVTVVFLYQMDLKNRFWATPKLSKFADLK